MNRLEPRHLYGGVPIDRNLVNEIIFTVENMQHEKMRGLFPNDAQTSKAFSFLDNTDYYRKELESDLKKKELADCEIADIFFDLGNIAAAAMRCAGIASGTISTPGDIAILSSRGDFAEPRPTSNIISPNGSGYAFFFVSLSTFLRVIRELLDSWNGIKQEASVREIEIEISQSSLSLGSFPVVNEISHEYVALVFSARAPGGNEDSIRSFYGEISNAIFSFFLQEVSTICTGATEEARRFDSPAAALFWTCLDSLRAGRPIVCKECGRFSIAAARGGLEPAFCSPSCRNRYNVRKSRARSNNASTAPK